MDEAAFIQDIIEHLDDADTDVTGTDGVITAEPVDPETIRVQFFKHDDGCARPLLLT